MGEFYKLLNVSRSATLNEIKASYRKLAMELHPDMNGGSASKTAQFRVVSAAYEVLSDARKRTEYDQTLGHYNYTPPVTSRRVYRPPTSTTTNIKTPVGPPKFNIAEWEAWHYGEGGIPAVTRKNSWMNLVNNKHQSYFARVAAREAHQRKQRMEEAAAAAAAAGETQNMNASDALRMKREQRKKQSDSAAGTGKGPSKDSCAIS